MHQNRWPIKRENFDSLHIDKTNRQRSSSRRLIYIIRYFTGDYKASLLIAETRSGVVAINHNLSRLLVSDSVNWPGCRACVKSGSGDGIK